MGDMKYLSMSTNTTDRCDQIVVMLLIGVIQSTTSQLFLHKDGEVWSPYSANYDILADDNQQEFINAPIRLATKKRFTLV